MAEYTIYPYDSGRACFSIGAFTYDKSPFPYYYQTYSTWEEWAEADDANYMREWLSLGRGNAHTSDNHIFGPMRMYFGFQIWGERTSWGTLREPAHLWLTYMNASDGRPPVKGSDSMQLWYCNWGNGLDLRSITNYRALWHVADTGLVAPATAPFSYLSRAHVQYEGIAIQLINTQHVVLGGPTWLIAVPAAERVEPPMEEGWNCPYHAHPDDPPVCPYGRPDYLHYVLSARFIGTNDGFSNTYWPRVVVGGQGTERTVVPLVPGPAQARGGKPGAGHRTRL